MAHGYEKLSAEEIRMKLVNEFGVSVEDAKSLKGKAALVEKLRNLIADENGRRDAAEQEHAELTPPDFESLTAQVNEDDINVEVFGQAAEQEAREELAESEKRKVITKDEVLDNEGQAGEEGDESGSEVPVPFSRDWHNFVMTHFEEDELVEGNPTVDGLRRVAQLLLGPITHAESKIVGVPTKEGLFMNASIEYALTITNHYGMEMTYCGVGDCAGGNTPEPYCRHPTATAESKAEGRALRKALGLRKVLAAEEVVVEPAEVDADPWSPDAKATREQKFALDLLCKNCDIDVMKFVNSGRGNFTSLGDVPFTTARQMLEFVHEYVNKKREVPEKLRGYKADYDRGEI